MNAEIASVSRLMKSLETRDNKRAEVSNQNNVGASGENSSHSN